MQTFEKFSEAQLGSYPRGEGTTADPIPGLQHDRGQSVGSQQLGCTQTCTLIQILWWARGVFHIIKKKRAEIRKIQKIKFFRWLFKHYKVTYYFISSCFKWKPYFVKVSCCIVKVTFLLDDLPVFYVIFHVSRLQIKWGINEPRSLVCRIRLNCTLGFYCRKPSGILLYESRVSPSDEFYCFNLRFNCTAEPFGSMKVCWRQTCGKTGTYITSWSLAC